MRVLPAGARGAKFKNIATTVDGHRFDSRKEARRYSQLRMLERAGEITGLQLQPRFPLLVNGQQIGCYVGDFLYWDRAGAMVVEDVKSHHTRKLPLYRWKKKHFEAQEGIRIVET